MSNTFIVNKLIYYQRECCPWYDLLYYSEIYLVPFKVILSMPLITFATNSWRVCSWSFPAWTTLLIEKVIYNITLITNEAIPEKWFAIALIWIKIPTSSWFNVSSLFSSKSHSLVIKENANTLIPQCLATMTSGQVLIPAKYWKLSNFELDIVICIKIIFISMKIKTVRILRESEEISAQRTGLHIFECIGELLIIDCYLEKISTQQSRFN